jgi:hypothetical protein
MEREHFLCGSRIGGRDEENREIHKSGTRSIAFHRPASLHPLAGFCAGARTRGAAGSASKFSRLVPARPGRNASIPRAF